MSLAKRFFAIECDDGSAGSKCLRSLTFDYAEHSAKTARELLRLHGWTTGYTADNCAGCIAYHANRSVADDGPPTVEEVVEGFRAVGKALREEREEAEK